LNNDIIGNVEHDEHMMIVQYNQLDVRSVGKNMAYLSNSRLHATRITGCIRMDLVIGEVPHLYRGVSMACFGL
jgi:hypothetical protein